MPKPHGFDQGNERLGTLHRPSARRSLAPPPPKPTALWSLPCLSAARPTRPSPRGLSVRTGSRILLARLPRIARGVGPTLAGGSAVCLRERGLDQAGAEHVRYGVPERSLSVRVTVPNPRPNRRAISRRGRPWRRRATTDSRSKINFGRCAGRSRPDRLWTVSPTLPASKSRRYRIWPARDLSWSRDRFSAWSLIACNWNSGF